MTRSILVTCPPMLHAIESFRPALEKEGFDVFCPKVVQALSEQELIALVPKFDGWIAGDDPVSRPVMSSGRAGKLRSIVRWGVGVDNVDFAAAAELGYRIQNTPGLFGAEVADVAMFYVTALARELVQIDAGVRIGQWPKPRGISLSGKNVGLVGYGNIGEQAAKRFRAADMSVIVYDPKLSTSNNEVEKAEWPSRLGDVDFLVFTSALTEQNRHMFNSMTLQHLKRSVRVVNVARGGLIDETALVEGLRSGVIHSAALDVFENEPLPENSPLRGFPQCVFGSHNGSNTMDAVTRASEEAVRILLSQLRTTEN